MIDVFDKIFPLCAGRVHEVTGPAAFGFTAIVCGLGKGNAIWVRGNWQVEQLNPVAFAEFCDPRKLLTATGKGQAELLALGEEALRSGAVSTVVIEIDKPIDLMAGRRLQLAAETGGSTGIIIIPDEGMGSNSAETRWRCTPEFDENDSTPYRWELIKNKTGTLKWWKVRWDAKARRVIVVSEAGERAGSAHPDSEPPL